MMVQIILVGIGAGLAAALLFLVADRRHAARASRSSSCPACPSPSPASPGAASRLRSPLRERRHRHRRAALADGRGDLPRSSSALPIAWLSRLASLSRTDQATGASRVVSARAPPPARRAGRGDRPGHRRRHHRLRPGRAHRRDDRAPWSSGSPARPTSARRRRRAEHRAVRPLQRRGAAVHHRGAARCSSLVLNLWLGAQVAALSGTPATAARAAVDGGASQRGVICGFAVAAALAFVPGAARLGRASASPARFGGALALIGLAVIHALTLGTRRARARSSSPPMSLLVFFGLPIVLLALLGIAESVPSPPRAAASRRPAADLTLNDPNGAITMEVILLERIARLGQMGDVVRVRDGYARNFLLPQGKALRATEDNRKRFESERVAARGAQPRAQARGRGGRRQARRPVLRRHPPGRRDRPALRLGLGPRPRRRDRGRRLHRRRAARSPSTSRSRRSACTRSPIALHPEVEAKVTVNVARSEDEAARQAKGEDLTAPAETARPVEEDEARPRARRRAEDEAAATPSDSA